jgi:ornithine cyclodeaminase/alanine dehydrogenase
MPIALTEAEVRTAIDMAGAIAAIEESCRQLAAGNAMFADRINMRMPRGWIRLMPAALFTSGVVGYKEFHRIRQGASRDESTVRYAIHLFDYETGAPLAQMDANYVTALRTGATAGVAVMYLAPEGATSLGIIGSGAEARTEIEAVAAVRPLRRAKVYSRDPANRERFAREMGERLGVEITPVDRPQAAIDDVEMLVSATGSTVVTLEGRGLRKGLHVNSIGSTMADQREIDPEVWAVADRIVLDTHKLLEESGDGIVAVQAGTVDPAQVVELHDVVAGKAPGRTSPEQTTLYKSVGTALQDVAVAHQVYQRARALGLGREIPDYESIKRSKG